MSDDFNHVEPESRKPLEARGTNSGEVSQAQPTKHSK
jgi:hypothetical protein